MGDGCPTGRIIRGEDFKQLFLDVVLEVDRNFRGRWRNGTKLEEVKVRDRFCWCIYRWEKKHTLCI